MKTSKIIGTIAKVTAVAGAIGGILYVSKKKTKEQNDLHKRYRQYYELTNQWLLNKNEGKTIDLFMKENDYKTVAIYGMGTLAELLYEELKSAGVEVAYFVDKNAEELYYGLDDLPIVTLDDIDGQKEVNAVIVTPVYAFDSIESELYEYYDGAAIVSLEDIVFEI